MRGLVYVYMYMCKYKSERLTEIQRYREIHICPLSGQKCASCNKCLCSAVRAIAQRVISGCTHLRSYSCTNAAELLIVFVRVVFVCGCCCKRDHLAVIESKRVVYVFSVKVAVVVEVAVVVGFIVVLCDMVCRTRMMALVHTVVVVVARLWCDC